MFDTRPLDVAPREYVGGVPVFYPTEEEFADFYRYNKAINSYGMKLGIVKIVPPTSWLTRVQQLYTQDNLDAVVIRNPIVQHINGYGQGVYHQQNMEKGRKYNIWQWKSSSGNLNFQPPKTKLKLNEPVLSEPAKLASDKLPLPRDQFTIDALEYSEARCEELEKVYWRSLTYAEPMYGADTLGSLFPDDFGPWNVAHLPNILDLMDLRLPGVNDAYLYAGLWKATFAWHLEDQDLYSINYIHFGAPKQWYLVPQSQEKAFFEVMKQEYHEDFSSCSEFLRHKEYMVLPEFLKRKGIEVNRIVHREGEFIITFPYGYHAGFNYGYNLAESVNFALDDWFPFGKVTKKCECTADAVEINADQLYCKFKGIPYVYHTPPMLDDDDELKKKPGKRKSTSESKPSSKSASSASAASTAAQPLAKRARTTVASPTECTLCPFTIKDTPLGTDSLFELLPLTTNTKMCHRVCARMFPKELTIIDDCVHGLEQVLRAQRKLTCTVCRLSGPCFQCAHPKCTRSYHAACALNDWVQFSQDNGTALCKYHRDRNPITISGEGWVQFTFGKTHHLAKLGECRPEARVTVKLFPKLQETLEIAQDQVTGFISSHSVTPNQAAINYWQKHKDQQQRQQQRQLMDSEQAAVKPGMVKLEKVKPVPKPKLEKSRNPRGRPRKTPKPAEPIIPGSEYVIETPSKFYHAEPNPVPFKPPAKWEFILDLTGNAFVPLFPLEPAPTYNHLPPPQPLLPPQYHQHPVVQRPSVPPQPALQFPRTLAPMPMPPGMRPSPSYDQCVGVFSFT